MKKIVSFLIGAFLLLQLIGCNGANSGSTTEDLPPDAVTDVSLYADILGDYENLISFRLSDTFEENWNRGDIIAISDTLSNAKNDESGERATNGLSLEGKWSDMLIGMTAGLNTPEKSDFGYIEKDINGDSQPELFWIREDGTILAIFTVRDGRPVLLDAFGPRYECVITANWEIYTLATGGAENVSYDIRSLTFEGNLVTVRSFGLEQQLLYETVNGENVPITEDQFALLQKAYPFVLNADWYKTDALKTGDGSLS